MHYAEHYRTVATHLPGQQLPWLQALRAEAEQTFSTRGFPSQREEEWRYTPVTPIEKTLFKPTSNAPQVRIDSDLLQRYRLAGAWSLVFIDGRYAPHLSRLEGTPSACRIGSVAATLASDPQRVQALLHQAARPEQHGFIAFTTAYFQDGALIDIPEGVVLEQPIQILHLTTQPEGLSVLRHLINLGPQAQASVIETYAGAQDMAALTASVSELYLAADASLNHYKLQAEGDKSVHFGGLYATQERHARLHQHHAAFGGLLARTEIHADLGPAAECSLDGLFLASNRRHLDTHTLLRHRGAHAISRESYRGIASDRGRGVFSGRIVVEKDAQKTDAEMNNRNLLLSEDAEIDSKPQLEIHADDVKCAHGVTVGQLSPESVFYLQSRGIDETSARNMLTFAFANELVEKIRHPGHQQQVRDQLLAHLPQADIRGEWL